MSFKAFFPHHNIIFIRISRNSIPQMPQHIISSCISCTPYHADVVESVPQPYVSKAPEHIVPILFLDSDRCHMMSQQQRHYLNKS
jgi:hypothetical protein